MKIAELKEQILKLPKAQRKRLAKEIEETTRNLDLIAIVSRRHEFDNKLGVCPHCAHPKYVRFGKDKGSQRYKCKSCVRTFTEYTGTWMAGIQRKEMISDYLKLMVQQKSLDDIVLALGINKKTALDWRHKILASLDAHYKDHHAGITQSEEAVFIGSEKTMEVKDSKLKKRRITKEQVARMLTQDRKSS